MPVKVSLRLRAIVTAGFANDVDDVNQHAAKIHEATAAAISVMDLCCRDMAMITATNPNVATNSPVHWPTPDLGLIDGKISGRSNIRFAIQVPAIAPMI